MAAPDLYTWLYILYFLAHHMALLIHRLVGPTGIPVRSIGDIGFKDARHPWAPRGI